MLARRTLTHLLTVTMVVPLILGSSSPSDLAMSYAQSRGRLNDQLANPAYQRATLDQQAECDRAPDVCAWGDPFRDRWAPERGTELTFTFRNRYGVDLVGTMFHSAGPRHRGPLPTVLLVPGYWSPERRYRSIAQGLAEAGYLVVAFDPQCQGASPCYPADAARWAETYCEPGAWQQPQELGVRELGTCAGRVPDPRDPTGAVSGTPAEAVAIAEFLAACKTVGCDDEAMADSYVTIASRHVFGAFDLTDWLLSAANPRRHLVDRARLAVIGHSAGAHAALLVANGDAQRRFQAAVSFDSHGVLPKTVTPRVPTMFQIAEGQDVGPFVVAPDPRDHNAIRTADVFRDRAVETAVIALGGSTHQEWNYLATWEMTALPLVIHASSEGERVALHYTRAWLDRSLSRSRAVEGTRRLTACTFDGSSDASSIGQGTWDPAAGNVPHRLEGETVGRHLSALLESRVSIAGHDEAILDDC